MIATQLEIDLVEAGKRSQMCLPAVPGLGCPVRQGRVYRLQPTYRAPGQIPITITKVEEGIKLGTLTEEDARREGHASLDASKEHFRSRHGYAGDDQEVYVIHFVKGDHRDFMAQAAPRWLRRGQPQPAICRAPQLRDGKVVRDGRGKIVPCGRGFADKQDICKCGAKRPPETEEDYGYTSTRAKALPDEPEAVSKEEQQQFVKQAHDRASHAEWEPIHGPADRIASDLPGMRNAVSEMRATLKERPSRQLKREVDRMEKAIDIMEKVLQRFRDNIAA